MVRGVLGGSGSTRWGKTTCVFAMARSNVAFVLTKTDYIAQDVIFDGEFLVWTETKLSSASGVAGGSV